MTNQVQTERDTQQQVVRLFTDPYHQHWLGYDYLQHNLARRGYSRKPCLGGYTQQHLAEQFLGRNPRIV